MLLVDGLAGRENREGAAVLRDDVVHRVLRVDAREPGRRAGGVADHEGVRGELAQRGPRVVEELEPLVARVRDRRRDLEVLDVRDIRGACV